MSFSPCDFDTLAGDAGTDKGEPGHRYGLIYAPIVNHLRGRTHTSILEIGVGIGASLRLWPKLFTDASIVAIDIDPKCQRYATQKAKVIIGDANNREFLIDVWQKHGPFDLVVDDGSHIPAHQILAFKTLWPRIPRDSFYICEDIETCMGDTGDAAEFFAATARQLFTMPHGEHPYMAHFAGQIAAFHVQ